MTADDQLLYEARVRPRQAVIAGVAAAALLAASITQLVGPHSKVNELTLGLITEHKRMGLDLLGAGVPGDRVADGGLDARIPVRGHQGA